MKKIYIDTSVIGGYYDLEFEAYTIPLFEQIKAGKFIVMLSSITEEELEDAPDNVRSLVRCMPAQYTEFIGVSGEAVDLANKYIAAKVVGMASYADCLHIAVASIHNADFLVSWNFKHIVNEARISGYNSINVKNGYKPLIICSPKNFECYENNAITQAI